MSTSNLSRRCGRAIAALSLFAATHASAQLGPPARATVFPPDVAWRVTVTRNGRPAATFTVPKSTCLLAIATPYPPASEPYSVAVRGRSEFHGDFELRAMPLNEAHASAAPADQRAWDAVAEELLARAPMVLRFQRADLVITNIDE